MNCRKLAFSLLAALTVSAGGTANAFIIGTPEYSNCSPFGWCDAPTYQQVYGASNFTGPLTISSLSFYNTLDEYRGVPPGTGTFSFWLSTTSAAVDDLSVLAANNLGADNANVYTGSLPEGVIFSGRMDINLTQSFNYDPSEGNLLLTVINVTPNEGLCCYFFDIDAQANDSMSRSAESITDTAGLVTGFNEADVGQAPAPATLALFGLGLAGLGISRRKRQIQR